MILLILLVFRNFSYTYQNPCETLTTSFAAYKAAKTNYNISHIANNYTTLNDTNQELCPGTHFLNVFTIMVNTLNNSIVVVNNSFTISNNLFIAINNAYTQCNNAYNQCNNTYNQCNNASNQCNNAYTQCNNAYTQCNNASNQCNNASNQLDESITDEIKQCAVINNTIYFIDFLLPIVPIILSLTYIILKTYPAINLNQLYLKLCLLKYLFFYKDNRDSEAEYYLI